MELEVLMFGIAREIAGGSSYHLELRSGSTIADLRKELASKFSEFNDLRSIMIAKNNEYAEDDEPISPNDEIAVIPPVSGG